MILSLFLFSLNDLADHSDSCLSFIMIFANILAMLYLVIMTYNKITKASRIGGLLVAFGNLAVSLIVICIHTCIFSWLTIIFTVLLSFTIIKICKPFSQGALFSELMSKFSGSYVIHPVSEGIWCYGLYNSKGTLLVKSHNCYRTIDETREAIFHCRTIGVKADIQDCTQERILDVNHPRFELYTSYNGYLFRLCDDKAVTLFSSLPDPNIEVSRKNLRLVRKAIGSNNVYIAENETIEYNNIIIDSDEEDSPNYYNKAIGQEEETIYQSPKRIIAEHLKHKFGNTVEVNHHPPYTQNHFYLPDNHFTFKGFKPNGTIGRMCFIYVYEIGNDYSVVILKLRDQFANQLMLKYSKITKSDFPNNDDWYRIPVENYFSSENELLEIIDRAKIECEEK